MRQTSLIRSRTGQNAVRNPNQVPFNTAPFLATVEAVYTETMTCDVVAGPRSPGNKKAGYRLKDIPVMSFVGTNEDEEIYGTNDLYEVGTLVIVMPIGPAQTTYVIIGAIAPYLYSAFRSGQAPVNSDNKQFAQKLLEPLKKLYRKIFRSGTSVEVLEDGTIQVETPSGTYAQIDESGGVATLEDQHGNTVTMDSAGVHITSALDISLSSTSGGLIEATSDAQTLKGLIDSLIDELIAFRTFGSPTQHATDPGTVANLTAIKAQFAQLLK